MDGSEAETPHPSTTTGVRAGPGGRERLLRSAIAYFAEHGIGDTSLRQVAAGIGTSHRMLLYHFGSREGLLTAVVQAVEEGERDLLATILEDETSDGRVLTWQYWTHVVDSARIYGPLFFELTSHAMRGDDLHAPLRLGNNRMWMSALVKMWQRGGAFSATEARAIARLNLAVARGLLQDLLLTGDRRSVDTAMAQFDWLVFRMPHPLPQVRALPGPWR